MPRVDTANRYQSRSLQNGILLVLGTAVYFVLYSGNRSLSRSLPLAVALAAIGIGLVLVYQFVHRQGVRVAGAFILLVTALVLAYLREDDRSRPLLIATGLVSSGLVILLIIRLAAQRGVRPIVVAIFASAHFLLLFNWAPRSVRPLLLFDLAVAFAALVVGVLLVSQFVLPVTDPLDRLRAMRQLALHIRERHGPVVFVQNGRAIARREEKMFHGRGVLLIDSVSGVVLQSRTAFTRAVGSGIVFTSAQEGIADTVDLRNQSRALSPPDPNTPDEVTTQALTRDGIEVSASINVMFQLDPGPGDSASARSAGAAPPRFNPDSAFRAVYGGAVSDKHANVPWSELPLLLAVDVWRELLMEVDLDDLFTAQPNGNTALNQIQAELNRRLKPPPGQATRESELLTARGINMLNASVGGLSVPSELTQNRIRNWQEQWQQRARVAAAAQDPIVRRRERDGQLAGQLEAAQALTGELALALDRDEAPALTGTLVMITEGTLRLCQEPSVAHHTERLDEMLRWLNTRLWT